MTGRQALADDEQVPAFANGWALFLDVDGTLLDIAQQPDAVTVSSALKGELQLACRLNGGAVALISGRSLADLDRLFGPLRYPAAGQHGLERRDSAGHIARATGTMELIDIAAQTLASQARMHPGILVEHKGLSLALHYRNAPELRDWVQITMQALLRGLGQGFHLVEGKMVCELKPDGRDKGTAIADFMLEAPFAGRLPVFIGDDVTDEDGFTVVNIAGGHSIKVGIGKSVARWHLCDAQGVRRWLQAYTAFLETGGTP